jgi:hypothetical protein
MVDAVTPHPTRPLMVHNTFQYHNTEGAHSGRGPNQGFSVDAMGSSGAST